MKYIYGLVDPRSSGIRYIGQTEDLSKRLQQHVSDRSNTSKVEWIRGLQDSGLFPVIVQLEKVEASESVYLAEYRWIYFGRKNGWELTNTSGMKSEDYYSMQGYFEKLIVEMERPENVPSRLYTMDDAKQEMVNILVRTIKSIYIFFNISWSESIPIIFCVTALATGAIQTVRHSSAALAGLMGVVLLLSTILSVAITILDSEKDTDDHKVVLRIFGAIGIIDFLITLIMTFSS